MSDTSYTPSQPELGIIAQMLHALHGHTWAHWYWEHRFMGRQQWLRCTRAGCHVHKLGDFEQKPFELPPAGGL